MSFKEVNNLRKSGRLQEAYEMAVADLQEEQSEWTYSAMFWVLRDFCNVCMSEGRNEAACGKLALMKRLLDKMDDHEGIAAKTYLLLQRQLTPNWNTVSEMSRLSRDGDVVTPFECLSKLHLSSPLNPILHEDFGWIIYRYLRQEYVKMTSLDVRQTLFVYMKLGNVRPSMLHSQILNFALNYSKEDSNFKLISFLKLWGPKYVREEDFEDSCDREGKVIPCLMSRIARAVVDYPMNEIYEFVELLPLRKDVFISMLKEHFFWKLYHNTQDGITGKTWELFEQYLNLFPDAPACSSHSKVLSLAERVMNDGNMCRFYDFFRRWNPKNLMESDWKGETDNDGRMYKSLAVKSLKKVKEAVDTLGDEQLGSIKWLLDTYDVAIDKIPEDDWLIRSKALLLIRIGNYSEAEKIYKKLCMTMGDKYYIWQEFSRCCNDDAIKTALLCKALSLEKNEDYIGKIRLELANLLLKSKQDEKALVELERYRKHYTERNWHVSHEVDNLISQITVKTKLQNNNSFYLQNISIAEEYAYVDIPFTNVVLVDRWKNDTGKTFATFVDGDSIEFAVNIKKFPILANAHYGMIFRFKLHKEESEIAVPSEHLRCPPKKEVSIKYVPLIAASSEELDWQILPIKYGFVQYVNTAKKTYHIYSTESNLSFVHYECQSIHKGDFVTFRQYSKKVKEERKVFFVDVNLCPKEEAIKKFKTRIVAVDDVNNQRRLFHFVLGPKLISGILHYDQTDLRPSIGDFIRIYYYVRKIEDKKGSADKPGWRAAQSRV